MGLSDAWEEAHPTSMGTSARNEAAGLKLSAGKKEARAHHASNGGGTNNKRRLTPMELKQQQRQKKEQRKRAKLASSQEAPCLVAPSTIPTPVSSSPYESESDRNDDGGPHNRLEEGPGSDALEAPSTAAASPPSRLGVAKEPLRRSASSPPTISCDTAGSSKMPAQLERHHTPPTRHPLGLVVEESRHPTTKSTTLSPPAPSGEALADRPDPGSPGARLLGTTNGFLDSIQERCDNGGDVNDAETSRRLSQGRAVRGGGGGGGGPDGGGGRPGDEDDGKRGAGVSLFHMVMSKASRSVSSSNVAGEGGVGAGGVGEVSKLSAVAVASTERAAGGRQGGRVATSSLSSLLRGRRESAGADLELGDDNLSRVGELCRKSGSEEDWMAMNLEKLSSFRVPETRMGFPSSDGDRKGLRRCATAPTASADPSGAGAVVNGERHSEGGGARSRASRRAGIARLGGHPGIQRWQLGSTDPMGHVACDGNAPPTPATPDAERSAAATSGAQFDGADVVMDHTLRTRVRFEMAPGVPIPSGIGSLPGHLESSALRTFAAGGALDEASRRRRRQRQQRLRARPEFISERVFSERNLSGSGSGGGGDGNEKGVGKQDGVFLSQGDKNLEPAGEGFRREEEGRACVAEGATTAPVTDEAGVRVADRAVETAKLEEALEGWRRATLYWVHPATPLPAEALSAKKAAYAEIAKRPGHATKVEGGVHPGGSAASGWNTFFWSRRRDWEQAFASLYHGLLARRGDGVCSDREGKERAKGVFYLQCPRFTLLWRLVREEGSSGGSGRLIPAAAMSQSTRRLRKRLKAAGVEFKMPLDPAGDQRDAEEDKDVLEEWKAMGATGNAKPGAVYSNEEERSRPHLSLLTFRGQMAVHGLFDFLLEACGSSSSGGSGSGTMARGSSRGRGGGTIVGDVPLLLSLEPFLNASLKALKVRQKGMMHRSRPNTGSTEATDVQVLELVGHVLPSALAGLTLAMASACSTLPTAPADSSSSGDPGATASKRSSANRSSSGGDRGCSGKENDKRCEEASALKLGAQQQQQQQQGGIEREWRAQGSRAPRMTNENEELTGDAEQNEPWLFRAIGTVDGETKYLNAGFGSMETVEAKGSALGSYVLESRARFASSGQKERQLVFDVCSTDPNVQPPVN